MRRIPLPVVVPVKGVSFHQDVVCSIDVGQSLEVVAEPQNEFDPNACAVLSAGEVLGHLPREIAGRLRADGGLCWSAEVVEVLRGSKATGLRIRLLAPRPPEVSTPAVHPTSSTGEADVHGAAEDLVRSALEVFARSGRRLGSMVSQESGLVCVRTDDGRLVSYPEALVLVRA